MGRVEGVGRRAIEGITQVNGRPVIKKTHPQTGTLRLVYEDTNEYVPIWDEPETDPVLIERNERVAKYPRTNTNDTGE